MMHIKRLVWERSSHLRNGSLMIVEGVEGVKARFSEFGGGTRIAEPDPV